MTSRRYITATETAKLARAALKAAFPGVRFSVRTDSAIRIDWIDGPPLEAVDKIAKRYAGSYFDGMSDYQGSMFHTLDGEPVSLGSSFVFTSRDLSAEALEAAIAKARDAGAYGVDGLGVERFTNWKGKPAARLTMPASHGHQVSTAGGSGFAHPMAALATWFDQGRPAAELEARSTAEADRLQVTGDDGYPDQWQQAINEHQRRQAEQVAA